MPTLAVRAHSRGLWRLVLVALIAVLVSCAKEDEAFPDQDVDRFVVEFYAKAVGPNVDSFTNLWSAVSTVAARDRWSALRTSLGLDVPPNPRSCGRTLDGDRLQVRIEPNADHGQPLDPGMCHTLTVVREGGVLKAQGESSPWEGVAARALADDALRSGEPVAPEFARALKALGDGRESAGDYDAAMRAFVLTREVGQRIANREIEVMGLLNVGYLHGSLERYNEGEAVLQEALRVARSSGNDLLVARAHMNLGVLNFWQAKYADALRLYSEAMTIAEANASPRDISRIALNLAAVQMDVAEYLDAHRNLNNVRTLSEQLGESDIEARALHNLGDLSLALGDHQQATDYYEQSLALKKRLGNTISAANTMQSLGEAHIRAGRYSDALVTLEESRRTVSNGKDPITNTYALYSLGVAYFHLGKLVESVGHLDESLVLSKEVKDPSLEASIRIQLGRTRVGLGDRNGARIEFTASEKLARTAGAKMQLWSALADLASLEVSAGRYDYARRYAKEAIDMVEALREEAGGRRTRQTFFEDKLQPYRVMLLTAVAAGRAGEALDYSERARARVLLDIVAASRGRVSSGMTDAERRSEQDLLVELHAANSAVVHEEEAEPIDPRRLQPLRQRREVARARLSAFREVLYASRPGLAAKRLDTKWEGPASLCKAVADPSVALLEFAVTESDVFLFTIACAAGTRRADVAVHRLPLSATALAGSVKEFQEQLAARDVRVRVKANELFIALLGPARSFLKDRTALVIVPDGPLWSMPFQTLMDGDEYVIKRFAVAYVPSLSVLAESTGLAPNVPERPTGRLFAVGNPFLGSGTLPSPAERQLRGRRFAPLPDAEREVADIRRVYGEPSTVYTGAEARERRFKDEAGRYEVLHLATHSVADDQNPAHSVVMFARSGTSDEDDGLLESWEVMELDLPADMAVLSACETARGPYSAGEGMLGMSWAFFVAGTATTIASLWEVESAPTTNLMVRFHQELLADPAWRGSVLPKARALQRAAQGALVTTPGLDPFYWAGFAAIGTRL